MDILEFDRALARRLMAVYQQHDELIAFLLNDRGPHARFLIEMAPRWHEVDSRPPQRDQSSTVI